MVNTLRHHQRPPSGERVWSPGKQPRQVGVLTEVEGNLELTMEEGDDEYHLQP